MYGANSFKFADIKTIRSLSEGSKLNDVMLSITGGAMRRYLDAKGELPETSTTAFAPISVRSENEKNAMGNQVSGMMVPLGSHIASAAERMVYVHQESGRAKAFTNALGARQVTEMVKLAPAPVMNIGAALASRFKVANYAKPFANTIVTNVPGPRIPLYSAGAKIVGVYGMMCLVDGVTLGHIVHSYLDDVTLSYTVCRKAMPDPDFYGECVQKSFEAHLRAAKALQSKVESDGDVKKLAKPKKPTKPSKPVTKIAKPKKPVKTTTVKTVKKVPSISGNGMDKRQA